MGSWEGDREAGYPFFTGPLDEEGPTASEVFDTHSDVNVIA